MGSWTDALAAAAGGPMGFAASKGVGAVRNSGGLSNALGIQNNYQASNPYDPQYLQSMADQQAQLYNNQMSLAQALQAQAQGLGPNPAQTQYLGNTQANIANTQGLIASQRGLNPALAARMGANAAAKANQDSALGSALLQQQQQLGATSNLGNLYGQMQQGNLGYQNLYNTGYSNAQNINQSVASGNTQRNAQMIGSLMNAAGAAAGKASTGGMSQGGYVEGSAKVSGDSPSNDTVHAMLSPGEIVIPRSKANDADKAKAFIDHLMKSEKKTKTDYTEVLKARSKKKNMMFDGGFARELPADRDTSNYLEGIIGMPGDSSPPQGSDEMQSSMDAFDFIPPEKMAALGLAAGKTLAGKLAAAKGAGIMAPMAAGAIRKTSTGKILGTVGQEALSSGEEAVQKELAQQAFDEGLINKKNVKTPFKAIKNTATNINPDIVPKLNPNELVKARFGDSIPEEKWIALDVTAKKKNSPYVPIFVKGKHSGFYPNMDTTPTGVIGNPKDFGNVKKIFSSAEPLNWLDQKYGATKELIKKHAESKMPVTITTASDLIAHDDYMGILPQGSKVNIVLPHPLDLPQDVYDFNKKMNVIQKAGTSGLPSTKRLLVSYDKLKKHGIDANVFIPDPSGKGIKELDPFTVKKLMNMEKASWSPKESVSE